MVKIHDASQGNTARVTDEGMLMVCLCDCEGLCGNSIPLKNLAGILSNYFGAYGGQGALKIAVHYQDEQGEWQPLREN